MAKKKNLPAVPEQGNYLILDDDPGELAALMAANLGGDLSSVGAFDLPRVQMPTGRGTQWTIPGPDGETSADVLEGIIVGWHNYRAYWPGAFSGAEPPQCSSPDGTIGIGDPGGECKGCPYAVFGSAPDKPEQPSNSAQACKAMRRLFVLQEGQMLPVLLTLPPTSLQACSRHFVGLLSQQRPYWSIVTLIGLVKAQSKGGIDYAQTTFKTGRLLKDDEIERVKDYADSVRGLMESPVGSADAGGIDL